MHYLGQWGVGVLDTPGPLNGIEQSECPNAELEGGMGGFVEYNVQLCTWSPNKFWGSNSIFNLCFIEYVCGIFFTVFHQICQIQGADDKLGQIIWKHSNH